MQIYRSHYYALFKPLAFLITLGAIAVTLSHISQYYSQFKDYRLPTVHAVSEKKPAITAITIGSSHSGGIDFTAMGQAGEYLDITGADVFEAVYTANQASDTLASLNTVYMAIAYPVLWLDNAKIRPNARIRNYYLLPRPFLPCSKLINTDITNCIKAWLLPITRHDHWEAVFKQEIAKPKFTPGDKQPNQKKLAPIRVKKRVKHHIKLASKGSINIQVDAVHHLERLIQRLQQQQINIVFFTPPYHPEYVRMMTKQNAQLITTTRRIMSQLSQQYDVFYKDYNPLDFPLNGFKNPDHLNAFGATAFSNILKQDVEQFQLKRQ